MTSQTVRPSGLSGFLWTPFRRCLAYRSILARTTWVSLVGTYAGSVLGLSWLVIGQFLLLGVYVMTYVVIFKIKPTDMTVAQYVLHVFAGVVPFIAFSTSLISGATALSRDRQVLLNTVFPSELLPVRSTLIASASLPVGLAIVVVATFIWGKPSPTLLLVPAIVIMQFMFQCGLAWILSLITLVLRDIQFALQYIVMMLMIVTPIAYTQDMAPRPVKILMYGNPLAYYVIANQDLIVHGVLPQPIFLVALVVISFGVFTLGFWAFERAKMTFFDYA